MTEPMPAIFLGHGNRMNAVDEQLFSEGCAASARRRLNQTLSYQSPRTGLSLKPP
jgi:hypothetical protein